MTALYFDSIGRSDIAEKLVMEIPSQIRDQVKRTGLAFLEKANPHHYSAYPEDLAPSLIQGLEKAGIEWYDESDFRSLENFRDAASTVYQF